MLRPSYTKQFKKDLERMKRRRKDTEKIKSVMEKLMAQQPLEVRHRDHWLQGKYEDRRECHIEPDWLLIYTPRKEEIIFERTGTHSDLFG